MTAQILKTVAVDLSERSYAITIGNGLLSSIDIPESCPSVFVVTDENVAIYAQTLAANLKAKAVHVITLKPGEGTKSFAQFQHLLDQMLERSIQRKSIIIAVGGGVIGDLVGFAAASILRGVDFIQVPTSLLAMVDSSVGGKTGINSSHGKNLIGAFYQPKKVLIDLDVLKTLPDREMRAGYAEIVKYGLLGNANFYNWLLHNGHNVLARDTAALTYAIETSCSMKANIVRQDEREEAGLRALLNLGHTFAHALEAAAKFDGRLLHGEAVGIGLVLAGRLSHRLGFITPDEAEEIRAHLHDCDMMTEIRHIPDLQTNAEELIGFMAKDKKATASGIGFIVLKSIGQAEANKIVSMDLVHSIIQESIA